jgi:hypothetical protein
MLAILQNNRIDALAALHAAPHRKINARLDDHEAAAPQTSPRGSELRPISGILLCQVFRWKSDSHGHCCLLLQVPDMPNRQA